MVGLLCHLWWGNQEQKQVKSLSSLYCYFFGLRTNLADAESGGEECADYLLRILPLDDTNSCNLNRCSPGKVKLTKRIVLYDFQEPSSQIHILYRSFSRTPLKLIVQNFLGGVTFVLLQLCRSRNSIGLGFLLEQQSLHIQTGRLRRR